MELLRYITFICALYLVEAKFLHLDYQYDADAKVWLKLHKLKAGWHQARKICNMEGATLASPLDEPLKHALGSYSSAYGIDRFYVGIHATFSSQIWHSVEGVPLDFMNHLNISQIESSEDRTCAVMEGESLINVGCQQMFPYVCYKRDNASRELTPCGTTDTAYKLDETTGNCYKLHSEALTWIEAYETCFAEQAYLAIINTNNEARILSDIFVKYRSNALYGYQQNVVNIGIVDWEHNGEWYTIRGERLQDTGFSRILDSRLNGNEYCGSLHVNGLLNDVSCLKKNVFICEKDVKVVQDLYTTESGPSKTDTELVPSETE